MRSIFYSIISTILITTTANSQSFYPVNSANDAVDLTGKEIGTNENLPITTAVPFLTIAPDARAGGMGDCGVSSPGDANAVYWNAAKLPFAKDDISASLSVTPWLRKLQINDMYLTYLSGYYKRSVQEAFGASLYYFDLGSIQFRDASGNPMNEFSPKELALSFTYARKLSDKLSIAPAVKYIHSNLSGNFTLSNGNVTKPGNTAAVDIGLFYTNDITLSGKPANFSFGAQISNLGGKITYTTNEERDFIPTNLRFGPSLAYEIDAYSKILFTVDINKLMVPSTLIYVVDSNGVVQPWNGAEDPKKKSMISGVFGSFTDAQDGFKGEMREFIVSAGVEYWYNNLFAIRGGYFNENKYRGNRKYFNVGAGIRYNQFGLDFAYLIPMKQNNPLAETLRFTLHYAFEKKAKSEDLTQ